MDELDIKKNLKKEASNSSKVILRKPMLQFSSFTSFGAREITPIKSPFSLKLESPNLNTSSIFTTSLVCFVCNSITTRKQPRKYGAVCCELCRKFMSKMIKKLASKDPFNNLQCVRNDGEKLLLFMLIFYLIFSLSRSSTIFSCNFFITFRRIY